MTQGPILTEPSTITTAGQKIYRERYQQRYEGIHRGKFLAIDIATGEATLADEPVDALDRAHAAKPDHVFFLMKIGSPSLGYLGNVIP